MASNLVSDHAGRVTASFTVPTEARNGNPIVETVDDQHTARASLQINDPLVITRIQRFIQTNIITRIVRLPVVPTVWRTRTIFVRSDPLTQIFSFTENRVLSAVGIQFAERDTSIAVKVQIRGVTTGLPNDTPALNGRAASSRKRGFDPQSAKYDFRVFLLHLDLIGDEFKTARLHLIKNMPGDVACKKGPPNRMKLKPPFKPQRPGLIPTSLF